MKMYYVAVVLPEELDTKIKVFKIRMLEKHGCRVGLKSPAHITIVPPFWKDKQLEQEIVSVLENISEAHEQFTIATNNFAAFKPRTIFIDVKPNDALNALKKTAENLFVERFQLKKEDRLFKPHITIATRDLTKHAFQEEWPYFQKQTFKKTFTAEGLSLLKHNGANWDVMHCARFGS